jgi:hypothetical protein
MTPPVFVRFARIKLAAGVEGINSEVITGNLMICASEGGYSNDQLCCVQAVVLMMSVLLEIRGFLLLGRDYFYQLNCSYLQ